jgi:hypothetical protein
MFLYRLLLVSIWLMVALFMIVAPRPADADENGAELARKAKAVLSTRCFPCHGMNGSASKNIFVLDRTRLLSEKTVVPGDSKSLLLRMVETGEMPLGGPELSKPEKTALRDWVLNGAPDWEEINRPVQKTFLSEAAIRLLIIEDLEKARERSHPFIRYFSIAHLYNAGATEEELEDYRLGLSRLLNSLSWNRTIAVPQPVDRAGTVLRIDLRDYNWTSATWETILAAYPYGVRAPGIESITSISGARIPYVRADWFVARASVPPLYHDLLGLPRTVNELEQQLGVNSSRNLEEEKNVVRAGIRNSGVSQNNRIVERHVSLYGAYWKSFDFRSNLDNQNIFNNPLQLNPAGGEIIFNLPNGMQAYFLADGHGRRLDAAPIDIVSDRNYPTDPVIRNGRSCMSCHFAGMKSVKDDVRSVVESQINAHFDREKALALYVQQETLDRLIDEDGERFRRAVEQAGGHISTNFQTEPINALARRYDAELSVAQASAESGLETKEFLSRVRRSRRLDSLGYTQLLISNGGLKRDVWESHFGDLIGELQLGQSIGGDVAIRRVPVTNTTITGNPTAGNHLTRPDPVEIMRSAQKIFIRSKTVFLKPELLENELRNQFEFQAGKLFIVKDMRAADLVIVLDRPLFTFTFTYTVTHPQTSLLVDSGKVTAVDGNDAAPKIMRELMSRLRAVKAK